MESWWDQVDITSWKPYAPESRGRRRPKQWIEDPDGDIWLRKSPPPRDPERPNTARLSEPAIELFALEVARRAGVTSAYARAALWEDGRGVVVRRFHASDEEHSPGSEVLSLPAETGSRPDAKARRNEARALATFEVVREKLADLEARYDATLLEPFARILVIDAWLGNGDRHCGNWALITGPRGARLAPMYDPTACLGVELTDEKEILSGEATDAKIAKYADKCPSGFGGGIDMQTGRPRTGIPMRELLVKLKAWSTWRDAFSQMRPGLVELTQQASEILGEIPEDWLSASRKSFAARLLTHRVTLLAKD